MRSTRSGDVYKRQLLSRAGVQAALEERAARLDTLAGRLQTAARGKLQAYL